MSKKLWPGTPIDTNKIQFKIRQRVGASDVEFTNPQSRSFRAVAALTKLVAQKKLKPDFSVLDICCGDGIILFAIKRMFQNATCWGFDLHVDDFESHVICRTNGIRLRKGYLQELILDPPFHKFDVMMMFNTFWGWDHAELDEEDKRLPFEVEKWLIENAKYLILTMNDAQYDRFAKCHRIKDLGKGEEDSKMVVVEV